MTIVADGNYIYVRNVWSRKKRVSFITEAEYYKNKLMAALFIPLFDAIYFFIIFVWL